VSAAARIYLTKSSHEQRKIIDKIVIWKLCMPPHLHFLENKDKMQRISGAAGKAGGYFKTGRPF
jgi:hypothetical protein